MSQYYAIGEYAMAEDPDATLYSAVSPGVAAAIAHDAHRVHAIEMTVALQADPSQSVVLRYASEGFTTGATDTPAHKVFDGNLARAVVSRGLRPADGGQISDGRLHLTGELQLRNDGDLDHLAETYEPDGRTAELRIGRRSIIAGVLGPVSPYRDFAVAMKGTSGSWRLARDSIVVPLRDLNLKLRSSVYTNRYAGDGTVLGGDEDLKGQAKPQAYGSCSNVSPILIWEDDWIFQFHDGWAEECSAVYDSGVPLDQLGDYPTVSALIGASVGPGQFATCLKQGVFRLGANPAGQVTCDVWGDRAENRRPGVRNWANSRVWANGRFWSAGAATLPVDTHSGIIWRLLEHRALVTEDEINTAMFLDFDELRPEKIGLFLPGGQDEPSVEEVCARVALAGGAFFGCDRSGLIGVKLVAAPLPYHFVELSEHDFVPGSFERGPPPYGVAPWSYRCWFGTNWTVQQSGLAGSVSAKRKRILAKVGRVVSEDVEAIRTRHPSSKTIRFDLLMVDLADAEAEMARLQDLYRPGRWSYRGRVKAKAFQLNLGQTVRLVHSRYGLVAGVQAIITNIEELSASQETYLEMFG